MTDNCKIQKQEYKPIPMVKTGMCLLPNIKHSSFILVQVFSRSTFPSFKVTEDFAKQSVNIEKGCERKCCTISLQLRLYSSTKHKEI